ncbi:uncharacterized protein [Nicotiana tomentosiformis]|uniref:uncharacterized protein n=1 Tax=Nicotiana tomentosiformis TaxID=4098 RepID=UPI00388C8A84
MRKFFDCLRRYSLKLNPAKCAFGVLASKLLGFIISRKGIEPDPSKIKAIQELPPPNCKKDVMSFLGRLNYISRFIAQSMHTDKNYIDPIDIEIRDQHAYYFHVDEEPDGKPWYHDIKRFLGSREYPENATNSQKLVLRRLENHFFLNVEVLYRRTLDLGLLRCVDATAAPRLLEEIHERTCGPHMNGITLAKNILRG